jgi:diaminopimelate epimerase
VNAHRRGLTGRQAALVLDGGELLITWTAENRVLMRGPAVAVFTGELPELV